MILSASYYGGNMTVPIRNEKDLREEIITKVTDAYWEVFSLPYQEHKTMPLAIVFIWYYPENKNLYYCRNHYESHAGMKTDGWHRWYDKEIISFSWGLFSYGEMNPVYETDYNKLKEEVYNRLKTNLDRYIYSYYEQVLLSELQYSLYMTFKVVGLNASHLTYISTPVLKSEVEAIKEKYNLTDYEVNKKIETEVSNLIDKMLKNCLNREDDELFESNKV